MQKIRQIYNHTLYASYLGYITQAIVNTFIPLLFLTFQSSYQISLDKITSLVTINFGIQLIVDLLSTKWVDRIGYRAAIVAAHICAAAGLAGLGILPELFSDPYWGLLLAVGLYAVGGGLIEVLVSPIVEACPTDQKAAAMSLLHSFYCWAVFWSSLFPRCSFPYSELRIGGFSAFFGRRFRCAMHFIIRRCLLYPCMMQGRRCRCASCFLAAYSGCSPC